MRQWMPVIWATQFVVLYFGNPSKLRQVSTLISNTQYDEFNYLRCYYLSLSLWSVALQNHIYLRHIVRKDLFLLKLKLSCGTVYHLLTIAVADAQVPVVRTWHLLLTVSEWAVVQDTSQTHSPGFRTCSSRWHPNYNTGETLDHSHPAKSLLNSRSIETLRE